MSDNPDRPSAADALDAAIERNAETVRRSRRDKSFLKRLGLSLPVTVDDVKQAFYARARESHPDHKGEASDFREVQEAFDEAVVFAQRNGKRLPWLGAQLPMYVAQREVVEIVEQLGGTVSVQELDWLEDTVGQDFAQLADRLVKIDLSGLPVGDAEFDQIMENSEGLQYLETLLLADTALTDAAAIKISRLVNVKHIDLRRTDVTYGLRRQLGKLPGVERVDGMSRWSELLGR
ncbi:MAG: hypothetical protein AAGF31_10450 [Planctomycetota bacterium]